MNIVKLLALLLLFAGANSFGQMHFGGDAAFDLIIDSVDADTATTLSETRDSIDALRGDLMALRDAGADDQDIDAIRDELHSLRQSLGDQVRDIVESNEELQAELRNLVQGAREEMRVGRYVFRNDDAFNEIIAAATTEQANVLLENKDVLDGLKDEIRAARDAGSTREDIADLVAELRTLMDEQRALVGEVLDANEDLLAGVLEDAQNARESARENMRDNGFHRRRPGQGG